VKDLCCLSQPHQPVNLDLAIWVDIEPRIAKLWGNLISRPLGLAKMFGQDVVISRAPGLFRTCPERVLARLEGS
jgi:hypothetical protein